MIKLENISKNYRNASNEVSRDVLNNVSFELSKGDSVSIVGPSGSGKSTLLNIMGTLDKPTTGKVFFNEQEIDALKSDDLAGIRNQHVGFVFQQHHLLPQLTLIENVLLPLMGERNKQKKELAYQRANELLTKVGLQDKMKQLPGQMSVGECQRAAVVRALINEPDVLLADEPTGSLDEVSAINLVNLLAQINQEQNIAVVMVTHSLELAAKMKDSYKLVGGTLSKIN